MRFSGTLIALVMSSTVLGGCHWLGVGNSMRDLPRCTDTSRGECSSTGLGDESRMEEVPDVIGLRVEDDSKIAPVTSTLGKKMFNLGSVSGLSPYGSSDCVVVGQRPTPGSMAGRYSTIDVAIACAREADPE